MVLQLTANIDLRNQFDKAIYSKSIAESLKETLQQKTNLTPTELGYLGATKMLLAKHYYNPFNKLQIFNEGKTDLENAIKKDKNNAELVFLRYSCAKSAPHFLNYYQNLKTDKVFLENAIMAMNDSDLKGRIAAFLKK
ncbi:MAG: hypothetical protein JHD28_10015 [Bacteroidia bacterium]|nr:hypothetical protein [Bacteroidia bacterium]